MNSRVNIRVGLTRGVVVTALTAALSILGFAGVAQAHNSLSSSEPADGVSLESSPSTWTLTFTGVVPLESASAEIVLADGSRAALPTPTHGASTSVIVFSLPQGLSGEVTGRWRLVGTDGHVIMGRVQFTVPMVSTPVPSVPSVETNDSIASGADVAPTSTVPESVVDVVEAPVLDLQTTPAFVDPISEQVRWVLQILSYFGLITVGGLVFSEMVLARGILRRPRVTLALQAGALAMFVAPAVKSLIHIADLEGVSLTSSFRYMGSLVDTTAGSMLLTRTIIGFVLLMVSLNLDARPLESRAVKGLASLALLHMVTVPFTGHSRSMRWPAIGVPTGIVHLIGITVWAGGLLALVVFIMPAAQSGSAVTAYRRFSTYASWAVIAIVVTGVIQTVRLYEEPSSAFSSTHGVILMIKVALVGVMLAVGWWSRRMLVSDERDSSLELRSRLIRVTALEAGVGVLVIGVSAAMVRATFNG